MRFSREKARCILTMHHIKIHDHKTPYFTNNQRAISAASTCATMEGDDFFDVEMLDAHPLALYSNPPRLDASFTESRSNSQRDSTPWNNSISTTRVTIMDAPIEQKLPPQQPPPPQQRPAEQTPGQ